MPHDALASLLDMLNACRRAVDRLGMTTEKQFAGDGDLQWVLFSQIVLIGEAANRIPRDQQGQFPSVPWPQIISMRNRIVHGYDSIDWSIVYRTVRDVLPNLAMELERLISEKASA